MAKFYGEVGYIVTTETSPGVFTDILTKKNYSGDTLRNVSKTQNGDQLNPDLTIDTRISILADAYAYLMFSNMRYVKWMGAYWKITSVEPQRPRLILTIGGVYNGQKT